MTALPDLAPVLDVEPTVSDPEVVGSRLRIQPGFVAVTALLAGCGWSIHGMLAASGGFSWSSPAFTLVFTVALLGLIAVHEAGHVIAARLYGHQLVSVRIGMKFGVTMLGDHTRSGLAITAAAGPVVGITAAILVLAVAPASSPVGAAAVVALIENVANVALFFMRGSDGSKIADALRRPTALLDIPTPTRPEVTA